MENHNKIQVKDLTQKAVSPEFTLKNVRQKKGSQIILDNLNLEIETGKITALIGHWEAGKEYKRLV